MSLNTTTLTNILNAYSRTINLVVDKVNLNTVLIYGLYAIWIFLVFFKIVKWVLRRYFKIEIRRTG